MSSSSSSLGRKPPPSRAFSAVRFVDESGRGYEARYEISPSISRSGGEEENIQNIIRTSAPPQPGPTNAGAEGLNFKNFQRDSSPGLKRSRSPGKVQRDSLKSRYSPGRPGSRRHQRWSNDLALRHDFDDQELKELYTIDHRSALSELFYDDDNMALWHSFCAAPEEEQRRIIRGAGGPGAEELSSSRLPPPSDDPHALYLRLDRRVKGMLSRGAGRQFVEAFELFLCPLLHPPQVGAEAAEASGAEIFNFEFSTTERGLKVTLEEPMHRLLAHAVCGYHSVKSRTGEGTGGKYLEISWPKAPHTPPQTRPRRMLHQYLEDAPSVS